jgi:BTB/POZ domain
MNENNIVDVEDMLREVEEAQEKVRMTIQSWEKVLDELDRKGRAYEEMFRRMKDTEEEDKRRRDTADMNIALSLRGTVYDTTKDILLKWDNTYFSLLLASPLFELDKNGVYFIDVNGTGFDRVLEFMNTGGVVGWERVNKYEVDCIYDLLDFFMIPHISQRDYRMGSSVIGLQMDVFLQLRDGRLCGATSDNNIHIWSMDTNIVEMTMRGDTNRIWSMWQQDDGRLRSYSYIGDTYKVWNIESGECEDNVDYVTAYADYMAAYIPPKWVGDAFIRVIAGIAARYTIKYFGAFLYSLPHCLKSNSLFDIEGIRACIKTNSEEFYASEFVINVKHAV